MLYHVKYNKKIIFFMRKESVHHIMSGIIIVLSVLSGYIFGRIIEYTERIKEEPPIEVQEYEHDQMPLVRFLEFSDNILAGEIIDTNVVLMVRDKLVEIDENNRFEIDVSSIENLIEIVIPKGMNFVASKKGKKFYPVDSAQGKKIKPSNRIYFKTATEALSKGYKN